MKVVSILGLSLTVWGCGATVETDEPNTARVRVAHLSPDAPAVDFCVAPAGTGQFIGPVLAGEGGIGGISYGRVTKYLQLPADAYDVRLVAPGSANCSTALGGLADITNLPELVAGNAFTLAATGNVSHGGGAAFALVAYADQATTDPGSAQLRFIHASPGTPNVDVGLGGGVAFTPVFANVAYGTTIGTDQGYVRTNPLANVEISARVTGTTTDAIAVKPVSVAAGANVTAFAIGEIDNPTAPLRVLVCNDAAPPHGIETECSAVGAAPERARVRIAHLSPDAPAVDICVAPAGGSFDRPLLASLGAAAGIKYPQVTEYVELPVGTFDVRVIAASETTCANAAVPDTRGITITANLRATVAALGVLGPTGQASANPGFKLGVFVDDETVAAGKAKLRFIHASPGTPNVDVGLGSGHGFVSLFRNVEFSKLANNAGVDARGYLETAPLTSTVSARLANATADALTIHNVALAAGQVVTAFAIGNKTGQAANPLRVLFCVDNARPAGLLANCAVRP